MRHEKRSTSRGHPGELFECTVDISNQKPTSLLTSSRNKFCSCSGLSRSKVNKRVMVCVRTYGRGSCKRFCILVRRDCVSKRAKVTHLEYLKHREEILLHPVLEIPYKQMPVRHSGMQQWLIEEVSAVPEPFKELFGGRYLATHFNFRSGAPPPTHQSTIHRRAFKLSSLPPFPLPRSAIFFKLSRDLRLCKGLP